ncbi:MAG: RecB family exonuclease, partial [Candidatus Syntropharchaeales archaeon]
MMWLDEDREHFSYNQLITMLACPYRYYLQYVEGREWDFVPSPISFGTAIHESVKLYHTALQNGGMIDRNKLINHFNNVFKNDVTVKHVMFKDESEFEELLSRGEKLIDEYVNRFGNLRPREVELEFRLPLVNTYTGELLDKDVVGKIDMVSEDDEVYEIKTSSYTLPKTHVDENLQLILYGWSFKMIYGREPRKLVLVNMVKTKKPKIQVLDTRMSKDKEQKLLSLMFMVNEAIEKEA